MVEMFDGDGKPTHYAHNPPVGVPVKFLVRGHTDTPRFGYAALLSEQGPNALAEVVLVTHDTGRRHVYFLYQVHAWVEIAALPHR
jgi:hypothetical protein